MHAGALCRFLPALAALLALALAAPAALAEPQELEGHEEPHADARAPPMDQLAPYLERVIPPSANASQWLADNAGFLPQGYRDLLLAEHPSLAARTGSAQPPPGGPPPAVSGSSSSDLPDPADIYDGETFAYGWLRAAQPDGSIRAQPGATVCLADRTAAGTLETLRHAITDEPACQVTGSDGYFGGHIFIDNDYGDPVRLWLNVSAANPRGTVVDGAGRAYHMQVNATDDLDGYITRLGNADMGAAEDIRKAFWILDSVSLGWETVRNATGRDTPHVHVRWLNDPRSAAPSSYDPHGMNMTVASNVKRGASHGAEAYPASILHEYGHHVMRTAYAAAGSAYPGGGQCTAGIIRAASNACAWADGWAYFFPSLALGDSLARYHDQRYPLDLEPAKWRLRGSSAGSSFAGGSAGQVAAALWDLHDGTGGEAGDTVGNATAGIWSTLHGAGGPGGAHAAASFGGFAADWRAGGHPPLESIMVLNGLETVRSLLLAEAANGSAARFADGLEGGAGSWIMSGGGNWRAAPAAGPGGSAALASSGCGADRGCEATAIAAVNASAYVRTAFNFSLAGGPLSVLDVQHSADGSSWATAASYNGSVAGWREAAVDAVRVEGDSAYLRLVAYSPSQNHSAVVDDIVFRSDSSPVLGAVQGMRIGEGRTGAAIVGASDPDGDAVSLSLAFSPVDDVRGSMITPNGSAGLLPDGAGRAESVWVELDDVGDGRGIVKARAAQAGAGNFTAVLTATAHGLSDSAPVRVRVDDVMPPVIANGTADRAAEAAHYEGTPVALEPVLVADNYDPSPLLVHNRSSSGLYRIGTTVVLYSAADSSGNSAGASQRIAVSDTIPPAIGGVPGDIALHRLRGGAPAVADYAPPTATDLGRRVPVECTPPPGAELGYGATAVSCEAVDESGNRRAASFNIAVALPSILHGPSSPVPVSSLSARVQGGMMASPRGIDTAEVDGSTYAVVAFSRPEWWNYDGVQIVNVTDPYRPEHVSWISDGRGGFDRLAGAMDVAVVPAAGNGTGTFAVAVSPRDRGIQVINITNPALPSPASSLAVGGSGYTSGPGQDGGIAAFEDAGSAYVIAAMPWTGGVYIANVTDPERPSLVSSATDGAAGFDKLAGASGVAVAGIGGNTYAVVASSSDDGVQIINITDPARPAAVSSATDGAAGFDELAGASGVAVAEIGRSMYAVVASTRDSGIQVVNITDPALPVPVSSATDGAAGFAKLNGASDVAIAGIGSNTYAVVAAPDFATSSRWYAAVHPDGGVQIVNITDPASPAPVAALADGAGGFDELYTANGIATAVIGPALYALVTSLYDDGLQVIGIEAAAPNLPPRIRPIPDMAVTETNRLRHDIRASDPNGDRLSVEASAVPPAPGLAVSGYGALEWLPGESQSGLYSVTVEATDSHGASANRTFALTVRNASVHAVPTSAFSSSLDGWAYKHVVDTRNMAAHCGQGWAGSVQYGLSRSAERGGSAHLDYVNSKCWFGNAGMAKSVDVPAGHGGGDMRIDLDYRTLATIYRTGGGSNNLYVAVSDSGGRALASELIYANERIPGQEDSGWRSATVYAEGASASACPCEVFVFTHDSWRMQHHKQFYLDNVDISVARPAESAPPSSGAVSGSAGSNSAPPRNSLTVDEMFAMMFSNGTRVVITEKIVDGTSVSLGWDGLGGASAYDVAVVPVSGSDGDDGWEVHAASGTSHRIDGLDPYSEYEVRVGVRGDPSTQSSVRVLTGG